MNAWAQMKHTLISFKDQIKNTIEPWFTAISKHLNHNEGDIFIHTLMDIRYHSSNFYCAENNYVQSKDIYFYKPNPCNVYEYYRNNTILHSLNGWMNRMHVDFGSKCRCYCFCHLTSNLSRFLYICRTKASRRTRTRPYHCTKAWFL